MKLFPVGLIILLIFIITLFRSTKSGFYGAMAILPLGTLAIITLGNFNLLAIHASFLILIATGFGLRTILPKGHLIPRLEFASLILVILTIYATFMSQILPRVFVGDIMVFSLQSGVDGPQISPLFLSQISELAPSSGNISQPVYFILSTLVFIFALRLARQKGITVLDTSIFVAASVNAILGFLDFINLDVLLSLFKTAEYSIFLEAKVGNLSRIVGAFPEASAMGSFSAAMFAYMFSRYLDTGGRLTFILASFNFMWAVLALSSTGFVALAIAGVFVAGRALFGYVSEPISRQAGFRLLLLILSTLIGLLILFLVTDAFDHIKIYLDELIFNKSTSLSALERGAWSQRGYEIGLETYGLGVGLGSTNSNGLLAVLLSNIGIPGMILYGGFLWAVFKRSKSGISLQSERVYYNAAIAGLVTVLSASLVSGTTANPGILFMVYSAIAVAAHPPQIFRKSMVITVVQS